MFEKVFQILTDVQNFIVDISVRFPDIVMLGLFLGLFLQHCYCIHKCIIIDADNKMIGARVIVITKNRTNLFLHILYASMFFGFSFLFTIVIVGSRIK